MKKFFYIAASLCCTTAYAQDQTPALDFVLDLNVKIDGGMINVGQTPLGARTIIPITGGTFEGPNIKGEVVSGGADYQLHTREYSEVNAIYSIRTDDGVNIFVNNVGLISHAEGSGYFFTAPHFEAPVDSPYAWLNQNIYVCRPVGFGQGEISLRVWRVCDAGEKSLNVGTFNNPPQEVFAEAKKSGRVEEFRYKAESNGREVTKRAQIYLPYGYDAKDKSTKYNVIYLMHGGGDNTTSFFSKDRSPLPVTTLVDNLVADGKIDPVIVVCPTFYEDDLNIGENTMQGAIDLTRQFNRELHEYLIPAVETAYNTHLENADDAGIEATRGHRAFGGFSMGALTTWYQLAYGINDVKYYIPLSGDLWIYDSDGQKQSADIAALWLNDRIAASPYANDFKVFGFTGTKDIAGNPEKNLFEALSRQSPLFRINQTGGNSVFVMKEGGDHWYGDVNQYLYDILPELWK